MMWTDPTGAGWGGAPMLHLLRARTPWPDLLFKDFIPLRDLESTKDGTRHERPQSEVQVSLVHRNALLRGFSCSSLSELGR